MLRTRLLVGSVLVAAGLTVLFGDVLFAPWYPGWLLVLAALGLITSYEMVQLARHRGVIPYWLAAAGVLAIVAANWIAHIPGLPTQHLSPWFFIQTTFIALFLGVLLLEMAAFKRPDGVVFRVSYLLFIYSYLGLLPSFLIQLRWQSAGSELVAGTLALIMAIFVPKCCDIGAYFTGRWLGKTRMTPVLSPKKTWEGAAGGLILAVVVTIAIDRLAPVALLHELWWAEIGFGITVGGAGILGDLAESMIKREFEQKDASQVVPGFGGVLDVIDAVLFAAPVAYFWFTFAMSPLQR